MTVIIERAQELTKRSKQLSTNVHTLLAQYEEAKSKNDAQAMTNIKRHLRVTRSELQRLQRDADTVIRVANPAPHHHAARTATGLLFAPLQGLMSAIFR